ncbi:MAG: hypothetical protein LH628_20925 [Microcoleus sp. CAN_BIN18]|nr:hypothetical protein [Microcoleus sp. CAN_BIN18]
MSNYTQDSSQNLSVSVICGIVCLIVLDYRSFCVWSIAHIAFLAAKEILGQREVIDRVGGAIGLGGARTSSR